MKKKVWEAYYLSIGMYLSWLVDNQFIYFNIYKVCYQYSSTFYDKFCSYQFHTVTNTINLQGTSPLYCYCGKTEVSYQVCRRIVSIWSEKKRDKTNILVRKQKWASYQSYFEILTRWSLAHNKSLYFGGI